MDGQALKRSSFPLLEFGQCWLQRGERQRGIRMQGERSCIDQLAIPIQVHAQIGDARLIPQLGHICHQQLETSGDQLLTNEIDFVSQFPNNLVHPTRLMPTRSRFALPVESPQAQELAQQFRIDDAAFLLGQRLFQTRQAIAWMPLNEPIQHRSQGVIFLR